MFILLGSNIPMTYEVALSYLETAKNIEELNANIDACRSFPLTAANRARDIQILARIASEGHFERIVGEKP